MVHKIGLFLRGVIPLLLVVLAAVGLPSLFTWMILGGPFGWRHVLIGLGVGVLLFVLAGMIFGWALGRYRKRP